MEIKLKIGQDEELRNSIKALAHQSFAGIARDDVRKTWEAEAQRALKAVNVDAVIQKMLERMREQRVDAAGNPGPYGLTWDGWMRQKVNDQIAKLVDKHIVDAINAQIAHLVNERVAAAVDMAMKQLMKTELKERADIEVKAALRRLSDR